MKNELFSVLSNECNLVVIYHIYFKMFVGLASDCRRVRALPSYVSSYDTVESIASDCGLAKRTPKNMVIKIVAKWPESKRSMMRQSRSCLQELQACQRSSGHQQCNTPFGLPPLPDAYDTFLPTYRAGPSWNQTVDCH